MKNPLKISLFVLLSLALITMSLGVALSAGTPVVTPGADPSAVIIGGLRYRELATGNDAEVFLGIPDLGDAGRRTQTDLTWGTSNSISLTYDLALDKLSTTVDNGTTDWTLEYPNFSESVRDLVFAGNQALADEALSKINYMELNIRLGEGSPAQISLDNVSLDANPLGSFAGVNHDWLTWQVNGYDLSSGFTLTGTLNLANVSSPSAELNKVEISFGNVNADTFSPTVSSVAAAPNPQTGGSSVTLTATVDDTGSGGSIIQSADYRLGTGTWTPMSAADSAFDSPTENVAAAFAAPGPDGPYSLCVRGTDSAGNTSTEQCTTLDVDSQGPLASAVVVIPAKSGGSASIGLTAAIDDSATGGSNVASAAYSTNGVDWSAMTAQDGTFDSPVEAVSATFISLASSGELNICVRGSDAAGNTGSQACTTLTVDSDGPLTSSVSLDPNPVDPGAPVSLAASVDDTTTGNTNISSAEYQLAGGTWLPMLAGDGSFDSPLEQTLVQFTAPAGAPSAEICVRGIDVLGNTGAAACVTLNINAPAGPLPLYLPGIFNNSSAP
jgi:hypothetical protein